MKNRNDNDIYNSIFLLIMTSIMARNIILYAYLFWVLADFKISFSILLMISTILAISCKDLIIAYYFGSVKVITVYAVEEARNIMSNFKKILHLIGISVDNDNNKPV